MLGQGNDLLGLQGKSFDFGCIGDESRLCCHTQAFGQLVAVTGVLKNAGREGWMLMDANLCEVNSL